MPFAYSPEYRQMVLAQIRAGRRAGEPEAGESTIHWWAAQDQIDRGTRAGTTTAEGAELGPARRRIAGLEAELAAVRRASEMFDEGRVAGA